MKNVFFLMLVFISVNQRAQAQGSETGSGTNGPGNLISSEKVQIKIKANTLIDTNAYSPGQKFPQNDLDTKNANDKREVNRLLRSHVIPELKGCYSLSMELLEKLHKETVSLNKPEDCKNYKVEGLTKPSEEPRIIAGMSHDMYVKGSEKSPGCEVVIIAPNYVEDMSQDGTVKVIWGSIVGHRFSLSEIGSANFKRQEALDKYLAEFKQQFPKVERMLKDVCQFQSSVGQKVDNSERGKMKEGSGTIDKKSSKTQANDA